MYFRFGFVSSVEAEMHSEMITFKEVTHRKTRNRERVLTGSPQAPTSRQ